MKVLVFAPHRDDEIIGVGGTILKRKKNGDHVTVCIVAAREGEVLPDYIEKLHQEMLQAHAYCHIDQYIGLPYHSSELEQVPRMEFNSTLLNVISETGPEEVYLPFWGDMQRDHQIVTESAMVALREKYSHPVKRIYAYETLSETGIGIPREGTTFIPNVFEDITEFLDGKKKALSFFTTQVHAFPDLSTDSEAACSE